MNDLLTSAFNAGLVWKIEFLSDSSGVNSTAWLSELLADQCSTATVSGQGDDLVSSLGELAGKVECLAKEAAGVAARDAKRLAVVLGVTT